MNGSGRLALTLALVLVAGATACGGGATPPIDSTSSTPVPEPVPAPAETTTSALTAASTTLTGPPPASGPDPSPRVIAFYYPWYGNPEFGGGWDHWDQEQARPPGDIGSDFYPELGAYSSFDPAVVAQHFAWLRQAGVGAIATSWWGQGTREDGAVGLLLDTAETYGLRVAFHIEPYADRSAESVVEDVDYIYDRYGDHPAFYRSTAPSRWSDDSRAKGLFFLWSSSRPNGDHAPVEAEYWQAATDAIHDLPDGGLVIADTPRGDWIDGGHFDGLYQYATLNIDPAFAWARSLPPGAWFVPSVIPGFSAQRIDYDASTYTVRAAGDTYRRQWEGALSTGIEPRLVSITSFNEWHEGTQIEPAASATRRPSGEPYDSYEPLGSHGYLDLTAELVTVFLNTHWDPLAASRILITLTTTSDWTTLTLVSGGEWLQPERRTLDPGADLEFQGRSIALLQPIDDATAGKAVTAELEIGVLDVEEALHLRIERGALGYTEVSVAAAGNGSSVTYRWDGWSDALVDGEPGRNPFEFEVVPEDLSPSG